MESPTTSHECLAQGCQQPWATLINPGDLRPRLIEAVFGEQYPELQMFRVCRKHHRLLRRKDGYTLGYHKVNGRVRAFVKEEHF